MHIYNLKVELTRNYDETLSKEYPATSAWWGAVSTAGLAEGGRVGEDKEAGNMDAGSVDWICKEGRNYLARTVDHAFPLKPYIIYERTHVKMGETNPRLH